MTESSSRTQVILATMGVAMALLLAALDQTVVGVAMPRIVSDLRGIEFYAWVTTAYLITSTSLVPVAGKLGDMFGRKPFMLAGMVGFIVASAICGLSQNMLELVMFRGIQGIFGGILFASTFAVMTDLFPPEQRARMTGVFGAIFGLSSVIGPSLGGLLTDGPGWRWVFYVNIPLGVVATILVATQLPRVRSQARLRDIDFVGTALLLAGLTPLLISLSMLRDHAWLSVQVLGLAGLAAVLLVAFFITERRVEHPIVPFGLFRLNVFAVPALIAFFSAIGMFGAIVFVPLVYQGVLGVSASNAGQLLTPMQLAVVVTATATGVLLARVPRYRFVGTAALAVMIVGLVLLEHHPHRLDVIARVAPVAFGFEVAEAEFGRALGDDGRHPARHLAGHEVLTAPWRLVIEEDAAAGEHAVGLAVVDGHPVRVELGDAVGAAWIERRLLVLRRRGQAEHF